MLDCDVHRLTLHDMLASMIDDEFKPDQIEPYVATRVSDISGGLDSLSVIPCSVRIDDFSTNMAKARRGYKSTEEFYAIFRKRRKGMRRWLDAHFDFTIVDCPPSLALQVRAFLSVADAFVIPAIPDRLSVRGSLWLMNRIRKLGLKIEGLGTLWSLVRDQNKMHGEDCRSGIQRHCAFRSTSQALQDRRPQRLSHHGGFGTQLSSKILHDEVHAPVCQTLSEPLFGDSPEE